MGRTTNTFLAFLSGAAVGTVIGILYAPDKGSNTRDKLTYLLDKYNNQLQELLNEMIEGGEEYSSEAKEEGEKVITETKAKAERLLEDVDELIGQIKKGK